MFVATNGGGDLLGRLSGRVMRESFVKFRNAARILEGFVCGESAYERRTAD